MRDFAPLRVWKYHFRDEWCWSCDVCHFGMDIPWEVTSSWGDAMDEVDGHTALHTVMGKRLEWAPVL